MATAGVGGSRGSEEEGEGLRLLGFWSSPFVLRARFALNLKGIPYTYVEEDLFGDKTKSALLLASNPAHGGKVPVLLHHGRPVAESLVIVEYIEEAFPDGRPRLLPPVSDPHERAAARFWAAYVDQKLVPTWYPVFRGKTLEERVKAAGELVAVLETFEGVLAERSDGGRMGFFGGESVGLVDVALGGFIWWLRASEAMCGVKTIDPARTPLVAAWAERFSALDGVREMAPDMPTLLEYHLVMRARLGLPFLPRLRTFSSAGGEPRWNSCAGSVDGNTMLTELWQHSAVVCRRGVARWLFWGWGGGYTFDVSVEVNHFSLRRLPRELHGLMHPQYEPCFSLNAEGRSVARDLESIRRLAPCSDAHAKTSESAPGNPVCSIHLIGGQEPHLARRR